MIDYKLILYAENGGKKEVDVIQFHLRHRYESFYVKGKKGIFEYILDGCQNTKLLNVRVFDEPTKKVVYANHSS
jgi:hypothetical protein